MTNKEELRKKFESDCFQIRMTTNFPLVVTGCLDRAFNNFSSEIDRIEKDHEVELSNYSYQIDSIKRERDKDITFWKTSFEDRTKDWVKSQSKISHLEEMMKSMVYACQIVVDSYNSDGMELMKERDHVLYKYCSEAIEHYNNLEK